MTSGDTQATRPTVLLISSDMTGPSTAVTGIRRWNLARVTSRALPVPLATPAEATLALTSSISHHSYVGVDDGERGHNLAEHI